MQKVLALSRTAMRIAALAVFLHLRNMAAVTEAGATVFPVIPAFYNHPQTVEEIARNYVHRVLQHIGLSQAGAFEWGSSRE